MNYKNNLLTKKKYKIVNQKAGAEYNLTLCVHYTDYFPNMYKKFMTSVPPPLNIKIVQNSWNHGEGFFAAIAKTLQTRNTYSISNVNGVLENLDMNEDQFINFLLNPEEKFERLGLDTDKSSILKPISFSDLGFKKKFEVNVLGKQYKIETNYNLCILYRIAFFECIPQQFEKLHSQILEKIKDEFIKFYKAIHHSSKLQEIKSKKDRIHDSPEINTKLKVSLEEETLFNLTRDDSEFMEKIKECYTKVTTSKSGIICIPPIDNSCTVQNSKMNKDFIKKNQEALEAYNTHKEQKKAQKAQEAQEALEAQEARRLIKRPQRLMANKETSKIYGK
jgi:hypothetical protein